MPILLFAAIVTRTFVQGFGVLFAIFIFVFVIPTPFVRPPGPLDPGIGDDVAHVRHGMAGHRARQAGVTRARRARVLAGVLAPKPDGWHAPSWLSLSVSPCPAGAADVFDSVEVHVRAASGIRRRRRRADAARITLRSTRACFPATRRAQVSTDAAFVAARRGARLWNDEDLRNAGPDSVAFLTSIEARGLPLDWRVNLNYVQADYSAGGSPLESLRPAITSPTATTAEADACLDAAGEHAAEAARRAASTAAHVFVDAAEAA